VYPNYCRAKVYGVLKQDDFGNNHDIHDAYFAVHKVIVQ